MKKKIGWMLKDKMKWEMGKRFFFFFSFEFEQEKIYFFFELKKRIG